MVHVWLVCGYELQLKWFEALMFKISSEATDWLSVMENQLWAHMSAGSVAVGRGGTLLVLFIYSKHLDLLTINVT